MTRAIPTQAVWMDQLNLSATDSVEFDCTAGKHYYVVVEAHGTNHLDVASGTVHG